MSTSNELFERLYGGDKTTPGKLKGFRSVWDGGQNPVSKMGRESAQMMKEFSSGLQADRESFSTDGELDFEKYFASLDGVQGDLASAAQMISKKSGNPITDRGTLRSARTKAIQERQLAKQRLENTQVNYLDESVSYKDPMTGEIRTLDSQSTDVKAYEYTTKGIYDEAMSTYRKNFAAKAAEQGVSEWQLYKNTYNIRDDDLSSGNEQMVMDQTAAGFASLATTSATSRMSGYQTELQLRTETATAELEARKAANVAVTQVQRDKVKQAKAIDKSITDINKMFASADHDFETSANAVDSGGVNFRSDRPT